MSENTTTEHEGTEQATAALVHLDPAALVIGTNVRLDARLDATFVASIAARGVLVPVVAHHDADGAVAVLYGQRRTLAAVQAGRATIPVHLVATPEQADRLVDQMAENDHRASLNTGERVAAFAQLAALGISAAQIAKRTASTTAHVKAALTTSASTSAREALERFDFLTLDQSAVLAEFDDDPATVAALVTAARRGMFEHAAQRARDERALARARGEVVAALEGAGVKVIATPAYSAEATAIKHLRQDGQAIDVHEHQGCPGHAAYVHHQVSWHHPSNDADDAGDDEGDQDDADDDDQGEEEAASGGPAQRVEEMVAVYVCCQPARYGHTGASHAASGRTPAADKSEAERAADAAARRDVIESNKAWTSATTVRRDWLRSFAARRSAPKDCARFIAEAITSEGYAISRASEDRHALARDLLGAPAPVGYGSGPALVDEQTTSARATVIALVLLLAACEKNTHRGSWRNPSASTARYLGFLAAQGYTLAEVEHRACGHDTAPGDDNHQGEEDQQGDAA